MKYPAGVLVSDAPTALVRRTQVEEQLAGLEVNSEDLAKMVATLEGRLRSVTQPMLERDGNKPADPGLRQPRPVLVPLAERIQTTVDSIRASIDRLRELNDKIELTE